MRNFLSNGGRFWRPSIFSAALAELVIVGGASLAAIFILIPNQTTPSEEIGLSPGLVPTVCAGVIGVLALVQFITSSFSQRAESAKPQVQIRYALKLMAAVIIAVSVVWFAGLLAGCTTLALLISLVLHERRIIRLALVCGGVALCLYIIESMGF